MHVFFGYAHLCHHFETTKKSDNQEQALYIFTYSINIPTFFFELRLLILLSQNVYWFQGHPSENDMQEPVHEQAYYANLGLFKTLNPDVMVLQEIQSDSVAKRLAQDLEMEYFYQEGVELKRYGGAFLFKNHLNCQIKKTENYPFQRLHQLILLGDFLISNVHLPSTRQLTSQEACAKRLAEMAFVVSQKPDLICGDFNETEKGQVYAFLTESGYTDTVLKNSYNNVATTTIKGRRGDFVFVKNERIHDLEDFRVIDLNDKKIYTPKEIFISDHFPTLIKISDSQ